MKQEQLIQFAVNAFNYCSSSIDFGAQKLNQMLTDRLQSILQQSRASIAILCILAWPPTCALTDGVCLLKKALKAPTSNNKTAENRIKEDKTNIVQ